MKKLMILALCMSCPFVFAWQGQQSSNGHSSYSSQQQQTQQQESSYSSKGRDYTLRIEYRDGGTKTMNCNTEEVDCGVPASDGTNYYTYQKNPMQLEEHQIEEFGDEFVIQSNRSRGCGQQQCQQQQ